MKQLYALLTCSIFSLNFCKAQLINKGDWLIGGTVTLKHTANDVYLSPPTGKTTLANNSFTVSPGAGYFFANRLAAGINTNLLFEKENANGVKAYSGYAIGLSPFVRYYFLKQTNKVNLLGEVGYGWQHTHYNSSPYNPGIGMPGSLTQHTYSIAAGPCFFITKYIAIETLLAYTVLTEPGDNYTDKSIQLKAGFSMHIGK